MEEWELTDNGSMNGILVNGDSVDKTNGRVLQPGDVITFGRKMSPPEFEYVFEAPHAEASAAAAAAAAETEVSAQAEAAAVAAATAAAPTEELFGEQMRTIEELKKQLEAEREQKKQETAASLLNKSKSSGLLTELHSEISCSICQDWLVHAATVECSHTFCWSCIDTWLRQKHFECPVCRTHVKREPIRTRAVDGIVEKTVQKMPEEQQDEFRERVKSAESVLARSKRLHSELERSVNEATRRGKAFFRISSDWKRKEKETFHKGVKEYSGDTRETYCKLTGLTVQWVHSADESGLTQALHNLQITGYFSSSPEQIRERLLMFLRYG